MLKKFLPKQHKFFDLFCKAADKLVLAAQAFCALINDLPNAAAHAKVINEYEHQGDTVALISYQLLHKTFVTPFDRHDIHALTTQLDDILDQINHLAQRLVIYRFQSLPDEMSQLANLCLRVTERIKKIMGYLDSLSNLHIIEQICNDIDQLENDAEAVLLLGIAQMFEIEADARRLMKLKEVYEQTKAIINACQDTANLAKSILLEYS